VEHSCIYSHKSWVILTVSLQALAFLPLIYFSQYGHVSFWFLVIVLSLYWGAGLAAAPAWNYWMGQLVPYESGQWFFSKRAQISQVGILLGLIAGGVALHNQITILSFGSLFGGLFFIAFLCRFLSALLLRQKNYLASWNNTQDISMGFKKSIYFFWSAQSKRNFFIFFFIYMTCVYISAPFVHPYFLVKLNLDYGAYMVAIAALMLGKVVSSQILSRQSQQSESGISLFIIAIAMISPAPLLWPASTAFFYILILQFISGFAWGVLDVGQSLIFYKSITQSEKIIFSMISNVLGALAIVIGTAVGGFMLQRLGTLIEGYFSLFTLGGILRVLAAIPLVWSAQKWLQLENKFTNAR
jgi:predicted MFS family arabinose efflux permease